MQYWPVSFFQSLRVGSRSLFQQSPASCALLLSVLSVTERAQNHELYCARLEVGISPRVSARSRDMSVRRRSSSINSQYGSKRERGGFSGKLSRITCNLSSMSHPGIARTPSNKDRTDTGQMPDTTGQSRTNGGQTPDSERTVPDKSGQRPAAVRNLIAFNLKPDQPFHPGRPFQSFQ